jgi:hypothetical protein
MALSEDFSQFTEYQVVNTTYKYLEIRKRSDCQPFLTASGKCRRYDIIDQSG